MPIELKMPALSPTMEKGILARWLVNVGDKVSAGDVIAEIETDKATMEFEAVDEGSISSITVPAGTEDVKVGTVIATLATEGETAIAPVTTQAPEVNTVAAPPPPALTAAAPPTLTQRQGPLSRPATPGSSPRRWPSASPPK